MRILLLFICLFAWFANATTFTEFYVQTTGGNTNSGHTSDNAATFSAASGNWTNSTGIFFKSGLNPVSGGVTNGAWAAIYLDAYPTNAIYIGLITNADDTADTINLSLAAFAGVNPADSIGAMSISVGGAWKGFTTNTMANGGGFPFNFLVNTATNGPNLFPRCNVKSGTTYNVASAITHSLAGPCRFQGYTSSPGDGGKATIDGGATGTSYTPISITGANTDLVDFICLNNGNSGTASQWLYVNAASCLIDRVVVYNTRRSGLVFGSSSAYSIANEVEAYSCNISGNSGSCGLSIGIGTVFLNRCYIHDNTGTTTDGISSSVSTFIKNCIIARNGRHGFLSTGTQNRLLNCDFYANGSAGIYLSLATIGHEYIENCNFIANTGFAITNTVAVRNGLVLNCGFGTGTMANGGGSHIANAGGIEELNSIDYTADVNPWVDAANSNFSIASGVQARAAGASSFTQSTINSPTNTMAFLDIGAAQSASTNAATAGGGSYTFAQ